jgi:hypothetical protein
MKGDAENRKIKRDPNYIEPLDDDDYIFKRQPK